MRQLLAITGSEWSARESTRTTRLEFGLGLGEFLELEFALLLCLAQRFARLLDHFLRRVVAGVVPLHVDRGRQTLMGQPDVPVDAEQG
ncbi:hypothetical protein [Luteimonas terrae]|uniref:Uncharacterized protein YggL (DUF469 family) n=1 Tax=Luteimonas terrae TaxID=1530191 RepID=A0ABU1XTX5_9GAMM|nr:hypothetical protein [Luteimonas terrae]MDR7192013.1 uncharacterized protein YggL (DUF469 family) [Luteimonas terrae]